LADIDSAAAVELAKVRLNVPEQSIRYTTGSEKTSAGGKPGNVVEIPSLPGRRGGGGVEVPEGFLST